jgi:hypothetical protein
VTEALRNPFDEVWPCWHPEGWECAAEWSMHDASRVSRGEARAAAAGDLGWTGSRVWKRYIRVLDRDDHWEWWVESRADGGWEEHPDTPPDDWEPDRFDESMPAWEFVHRSHPEAWPVWVVGEDTDAPPHKPMRRELVA